MKIEEELKLIIKEQESYPGVDRWSELEKRRLELIPRPNRLAKFPKQKNVLMGLSAYLQRF